MDKTQKCDFEFGFTKLVNKKQNFSVETCESNKEKKNQLEIPKRDGNM